MLYRVQRKNRFVQAGMYHDYRVKIKCFNQLKMPLKLNQAFSLLNYLVTKYSYQHSFQTLKKRVTNIDLIHRDWAKYRQHYLKSQVLIRWREHSVKQKLARMYFKKTIIKRLRNYVEQKNFEIPYQFWSRYRQILFFKVLRYNSKKSKKSKRKNGLLQSKMSDYRYKLLKKSFVGLLEHIYLKKREAMIYSTVYDFRKH